VSDDWNRLGSGRGQGAPAAELAQPRNGGDRSRPTIPDNQPERVEVIGAMATGVAHEFNNLLTIVLGSLEQLRRQTLDERGLEQLERAVWSVHQAGRLARQVLSFVRRDARQLQHVDLNAVIGEFDRIISHAASDRISLVWILCQEPLPVCLDPGQLELALLNLVRNATDAISGTGSITIRTAAHRVDGLDGQQIVEVSVSDTGTGMPPEIAERATASFFTTKQPGRGTGLGLWMVSRFAAACGGRLDIETALGKGTTVKLVFPRTEPSALQGNDAADC
jgi:signal transduction histidine kinase